MRVTPPPGDPGYTRTTGHGIYTGGDAAAEPLGDETPAPLALLLESHRAFLRYVERRVGDRELAEDILQDAFAKVMDRPDQAPADEGVVPWLYRLLRNAAIDQFRRRGGANRAVEVFARELETHAAPEPELEADIETSGRTHVRVETEYDLLLTNRLVLQPLVEFEIYGRADPERRIDAGLSTGEFGLRLRYEFRREFAPYVGVVWNRKFFGTADYAQQAGERTGGARLAVGVRFWM